MTFTAILLVIMGLSSKRDGKVNYARNTFTVILAPFQKFINYVENQIDEASGYLRGMNTLSEENEILKSRVAELENDVKELSGYRTKNEELREALNIKQQFSDVEFLGANIIAKDMGNWFHTFTIDRGTKDMVNVDLPVITNNGLVGRVVNADLITSRVISIIDEDSTVSARISKTRDLVFVRGDLSLKDQGLCRLDNIFPDVDISVGDTIETSGLGGIYPKGVIIGVVKEIRRRTSDLNRYAIIEPSVDFKRLEEVFVLIDRKNINRVGEIENEG